MWFQKKHTEFESWCSLHIHYIVVLLCVFWKINLITFWSSELLYKWNASKKFFSFYFIYAQIVSISALCCGVCVYVCVCDVILYFCCGYCYILIIICYFCFCLGYILFCVLIFSWIFIINMFDISSCVLVNLIF